MFQYPEGAVIARGFTDRTLEAFDRFEVVVENIGAGVEHQVKVFLLAAKVGGEYFDGAFGHAMVDGADCSRPD